MMSREDFIFTLGYEGSVAIVDGRAKRKYRGYSAPQLAEAGLFKAAVCAALYDEDQAALEKVLRSYNSGTEKKVATVEELKRVFGVTHVPKDITKVNVF